MLNSDDDDWVPVGFTPGPDAIAIDPSTDSDFVKKPFLGFSTYVPRHRLNAVSCREIHGDKPPPDSCNRCGLRTAKDVR